MIHGTRFREFDGIALEGNSTANHFKHIMEVLLEYFSPLNSLYNQKRTMRRAMRELCDMLFTSFAAQLTEINKFLPLFLGSNATKKTPLEEINKILLTITT